MPSSGSITQSGPSSRSGRLPSSDKIACPGAAARMTAWIAASARWSASVTTLSSPASSVFQATSRRAPSVSRRTAPPARAASIATSIMSTPLSR